MLLGVFGKNQTWEARTFGRVVYRCFVKVIIVHSEKDSRVGCEGLVKSRLAANKDLLSPL